jgi:hypothetical protein
MRWVVVIATVALAVTASAAAELVARAPDGMLAVAPNGRPHVGYVRGKELVIAQRVGANRWRRETVRVPKGSGLAAFAVGVRGPVATLVGPGERSVFVVRRQRQRWAKTVLTRRLQPLEAVGWPGLALDRTGLPVVAYTRWNSRTRYSHLILAKISARGKAHTQHITAGGFPKSYVAPPAAPVVLPNGGVHVVETYGISGAVGTIEWMPRRSTWIGLYLSAGLGGFPIGPMFAAVGRGRVLYAAWSEAFLGTGFPVTLATRGREVSENLVSEQGLTTGLMLTRRGPQVAANEWISSDALGFPVGDVVWAATVTGRGGSELDGRLAGLAAVPRTGAQDLLLSRRGVLSWFRARGSLPVHVTLEALEREDGAVVISGRVQGARGGRVTVYRERSETSRQTAGTLKLGAGGLFSLVDPPRAQPTLYRAVYVDPATGIPYAKLLREPVGAGAPETPDES